MHAILVLPYTQTKVLFEKRARLFRGRNGGIGYAILYLFGCGN